MTYCFQLKCKRKVSMVDRHRYRCKCNRIFCRKHFLSHDCTYDYKGDNQTNLMRTMSVLCATKIKKI